jgi:hypothetical protein
MYNHIESLMQFADRRVSWKIASGAENLVLQALNFNRWVSASNSQAGQTYVIRDLMRALWRSSLILVLNRFLLNMGYVVINALKALASISSMFGIHVIFLSNTIPRYFKLFTNGIFRAFSVRGTSRQNASNSI